MLRYAIIVNHCPSVLRPRRLRPRENLLPFSSRKLIRNENAIGIRVDFDVANIFARRLVRVFEIIRNENTTAYLRVFVRDDLRSISGSAIAADITRCDGNLRQGTHIRKSRLNMSILNHTFGMTAGLNCRESRDTVPQIG